MKVQRLLSKVKYTAFKLKEGGQIPPSLFLEICSLDQNSKEEDIQVLMEITEHLTRIKGYYFRFAEMQLGIDIKQMISECKEARKGKKVNGSSSSRIR